MADIKAVDVAKLRKATGAGMMDCKKALQEANGDFEKGIDIIRKRGQSVANKRADRDAGEGTVQAKVEGKFGAIISLNCETDFVAKNENFIAFAKSILDLAIAEKPADLDALKGLNLDGKTVSERVLEQTGVIGEKLELSYYEFIQAESVIAYNHIGNNLATLVGFNKAGVDNQVAKDIAMQVAAMAPVAVDKDAIPQDVIEKEIEIAKEKFRQEGKPEAMLDKIAQGSLNKWFKEVTLLNQTYVKDGKISIKDFLKQNDSELTVTAFDRFTLNV